MEVLKKTSPSLAFVRRRSSPQDVRCARRVSNAEVRCARLRVSPATAVTPRFQSVGDTTERTEGRCAGLDSKKKRVVSDDCKTK
jgi:hypothetical protein